MTIDETRKLLAGVQALYPKFMDGRDPQITLEWWARLFAEEPYGAVAGAVEAFAAKDAKGFPPAPGALKAELAAMQDDGLTTEQAWALVRKQLRGDALYNCRKAYLALPEDVRAAVGCPETLRAWAEMESETVSSVIYSQFRRSYEARRGHVREMMMLPPAVRELYVSEAKRMPEVVALPEREKPNANLGTGTGSEPPPEFLAKFAHLARRSRDETVREELLREKAARETARAIVAGIAGAARRGDDADH